MTTTINMGTGSTVMAYDDTAGSIAFWKHRGGTFGDQTAIKPTTQPDVRIKFSSPESIGLMIERLSKIKEGMEAGNGKEKQSLCDNHVPVRQ